MNKIYNMVYLFKNEHRLWTGWMFYTLAVAGLVLQIGFDGEVFNNLFEWPVFSLTNDQIFAERRGWIIENNVLDELIVVGLIISGLVHGFSRARIEDEMIAKIRMEALVWSLFWSYALLAVGTLVIYGTYYFQVMTFQMFLVLLMFNIRFDLNLMQHYKLGTHDE